MPQVWKQRRRVDAGQISVKDLDMRIEVENKEDGNHRFDVQFWNLADGTWEGVEEGDMCRVLLGWDETEVQNVIQGVVEKKTTKPDPPDRIFRLKGTSKNDQLLKNRFNHSRRNVSPGVIVNDIAGRAGFTTGQIDEVGSTIDGGFQISEDKPIRHWLDELKKEAERMTDEGWEWFVDGGRLYFVKKNGRTSEAVKLSYENTLLSLNSVESDAENASGLEFEALCEPKLRKGAAVGVDTDDHQGAYKVTEYQYVSDTTNGDHYVEGTLQPLDIQYTPSTEQYRGGIDRYINSD